VASSPRAGNLITDLVGDFRNLASKDSAKWLGIGASIALVGHVGDHGVSRALATPNLHEAFESGQTLGGTPLQIGGAFATYAVGRMSGSSRTAAVGSELFRAQIVAQTLTSVMKVSAGRSRPDGQTHSFPSGHTASAFASATVLQRNFGWKVGIPAYALASYVATSRIQTQRHYLSDVAFGAAVGILAGRTVTVGTAGTRFAVEPFAVSGGGGVSFNLVRKP
jgi:membrane-associated phospholipid phosphatase